MENLMSRLSVEEKRMIERYIDAYATDGDISRSASVEYILDPWSDNKSEYLADMFGDSLILSRPIELQRDDHDMANRIEMMMRINHQCSDFEREYFETLREKFRADYNDYARIQVGSHLETLMYSESLVTNIYRGPTVEVTPPSVPKAFKIQTGAKVLKTLSKLVEALGLNQENFEAFRIAHSQVLNQKSFTGNLCLSIHPLDYMTMSDNDCDWSSCMSWENGGCYRQGTVEMMNSKCVVVAYLRSATDMQMPGFFSDKYTWNSKKWRELFIVTPQMIANVKGYPYQNDSLSKYVLAWLKELAEKSKLSNYFSEVTEWTPWTSMQVNGKEISIDPHTHYMYNDYNSNRVQFAYFSDCIGQGAYHITYSGPSECMACGETDVYCENEGMLIGECCDKYYECEECGCHYYDRDELTEVDGELLCQDCIDNHCQVDIFDNLHLEYNLTAVHLAVNGNLYNYDNVYVYNGDLKDSRLMRRDMSRYFKCIHRISDDSYVRTLFVNAEECTKDGLQLFGYISVEDCDACHKHCFDYEYRSLDGYELMTVTDFNELMDTWHYDKLKDYVYDL